MFRREKTEGRRGQRTEIGGRRSEVRGQEKTEVGSRRSEVGGQAGQAG